MLSTPEISRGGREQKIKVAFQLIICILNQVVLENANNVPLLDSCAHSPPTVIFTIYNYKVLGINNVMS